jgi:secreted Zn-dependent insulinase-like peptidase
VAPYRDKVFANLWKMALNEHLREFKQQGKNAKLGFSLDLLTNSLSFTWTGFNDSLEAFVL